jgi:hypothetical protein
MEVTIKIYFKETGYEFMEWLHLAQDRFQKQALVNMAMKLRVPLRWEIASVLPNLSLYSANKESSFHIYVFNLKTRSQGSSVY